MSIKLVVGDEVGYKKFSGDILRGIIKDVTPQGVVIQWGKETPYPYSYRVIRDWGDLFFIIRKRSVFASKAEEINNKIKFLEERFKNRKKYATF